MSMSEDSPEHEYEAGDRLTLQQAATLFAVRDLRPYDTLRLSVGRWRNRIQTAVKKGSLSEKLKTFEISELVSWALQLTVQSQTDWHLKLKGLPRKTAHGQVSERVCVTDSIHDLALPGDLSRSHNEIRRLANENEILRKQLSHLQAEVSVLRPKAGQYDRICKNNQSSGRKPKTPRDQKK